jgi:membrane fusion protein (multidrug efflux system)
VLLPGAFAAVELPVSERQPSIVVPAQAIVPSATGHAVYVLRNGHAELQEVEIGTRLRGSVQIRSGLEAGDTVLTTNLLRLRSGIPVEVLPPG